MLTAKRWEILRMMTGAGPVAICNPARRVGRDAMAVHGDVYALIDAGILRQDTKGKIEFPYDAVRVDFTPKAA